ncbi:hypothetical protein M5G22_04800 [Pseudomonas sp. TNT2022 ID233]|nr:hypothetical protein [Pseudomonas aphyarum]MDD1136867.1 hypothetical protein [Pseudomonas aphyarum]
MSKKETLAQFIRIDRKARLESQGKEKEVREEIGGKDFSIAEKTKGPA